MFEILYDFFPIFFCLNNGNNSREYDKAVKKKNIEVKYEIQK